MLMMVPATKLEIAYYRRNICWYCPESVHLRGDIVANLKTAINIGVSWPYQVSVPNH